MKTSDQAILLDIAKSSISYGFAHDTFLPVNLSQYSNLLHETRATFVTLHNKGQLRGCVGTLSAIRSILEDISHNAFNAAFRDPRFLPVRKDEIDQLNIQISILSDCKELIFTSEQSLLEQLRPGIDGLVLSEGKNKSTFLPSVWDEIPTPEQFLVQLKKKAGLPQDYWSNTIRIEQYTVEQFGCK